MAVIKCANETSGSTSHVSRELRNGKSVYIKTLAQGPWEGSVTTIQARVDREAYVITRLGELPLRGRLGRPKLVDWESHTATVITEAVPGEPLSDLLSRRSGGKYLWQHRSALLLAGRWLRYYQSLPYSKDGIAHIGENSPADLLEYCDIRLRSLRSSGCDWLTGERARATREAIALLMDTASPLDKRDVWCHGDYAPGNIIWDGVTLTPIDFTMANLGPSLLDVTYFIHRLEMLPIYFPWRSWPIHLWKRAFLRGYGRANAEQSAMYRALMIRHWLCRLLTYVVRPARTPKQRWHARWIRACVRRRLLQMVKEASQ